MAGEKLERRSTILPGTIIKHKVSGFVSGYAKQSDYCAVSEHYIYLQGNKKFFELRKTEYRDGIKMIGDKTGMAFVHSGSRCAN